MGLTRVSPPPPVAPNTSKTQCLTAPSPSDHEAQQRPQRSNLTKGKPAGDGEGRPGVAPLPVGGWPGSPVLASPLQSHRLPPSPRGESWSWEQPWSLLCPLGGWVSPAHEPLTGGGPPPGQLCRLGLAWLVPVL